MWWIAFQNHGRSLTIRLLVLAAALAFTLVWPSARAEAACTVPNLISNGQPADATAVMGNFNALNDCVNSAVSPSGTPVAGNLSVFSSPKTVTSGNLSGDCTTTGTLSVTCTKTNGTSFGHFATGTDAGQLTGTISVDRFNNGANASSSTFLRGDGVWGTPSGGGGGSNSWYWNPPGVADFPTIVTEGSASNISVTDDPDLGLAFVAKAGANDHLYAIMKDAPAFPFTITAHFVITTGNNGNIGGIVLRNSSTGTRIVFGADPLGGKGRLIARKTTGTTYVSNITYGDLSFSSGLWLRVVVTSPTNISYFVSGNGKTWALLQTTTANVEVPGLDQIGIGTTRRGSAVDAMAIDCDYWNVS